MRAVGAAHGANLAMLREPSRQRDFFKGRSAAEAGFARGLRKRTIRDFLARNGDRLLSVADRDMRHGRKSFSWNFDGHKGAIAWDVDTGLVVAVGPYGANERGSEERDFVRVQSIAFADTMSNP